VVKGRGEGIDPEFCGDLKVGDREGQVVNWLAEGITKCEVDGRWW